MKAFKTFLAGLFFLLAASSYSLAEEGPAVTGQIKGKVIDDSSGKAMEYANIHLYSLSDSTLITGTISSPDGSFLLEKVKSGRYYLVISFIGFENTRSKHIEVSSSNKIIDLGNIKLSPISTDIDEVNVVSEKLQIEYQIDKRVINVDKNLAASGGTAVQVLENTPSVQVDAEGNVSLRGSSDFVVLIDDKPTILKGSDALKQIPAANIDKIEVITNPSAKYEADGSAGIINIKTKKNKLNGFSGMFNASVGTGDKKSTNINLNYRMGKINFFLGGEYMDNKYPNSISYKSTQYLSSGTNHTIFNGELYQMQEAVVIKGGIDYTINDKNSLSVSGSAGDRGFDSGGNTDYTITTEGNTSYSESETEKDVVGHVKELNADFTHTFGERHNWITSLHYDQWDGYNNSKLEEFETDENGNRTATTHRQRLPQDEFNYLYRINTDYKRPIGQNGRIEAGYQFRFHDRTDDLTFEIYDNETDTWQNNSTFTNKMDYQRYIQSAYTMYANQIKGFGYQIGLRAEYTDRNIKMSGEDKTYTYNKLSLFPSAHISKELPNKQQMQASYSRRTRRPVAWLLNGTPGFIDANNIFKGNPEVEPEYTNSYELNYRKNFKKLSVSVQTYYKQTLNRFTQIRTMDDNGVTTHLFSNSGEDRSAGVELGTNINAAKWLQINLNTNFYNYEIEGEIEGVQTSQRNITWDANMNTTVKLKWKTKIQLNTYYSAESVDLQGKRSDFITFTLSANKTFLDGRASLGVVARDVFNTFQFDYLAEMPNYRTEYKMNPEQVFSINFTYRFNNYQQKNRGSRDKVEFGGSGGF